MKIADRCQKASTTLLLTCRIRVHFYETYNCMREVRRPANRRALLTKTAPTINDWTWLAWSPPISAFNWLITVLCHHEEEMGIVPSYTQLWFVRCPKHAALLLGLIGPDFSLTHVTHQKFLVQAWTQPTMKCDWWNCSEVDLSVNAVYMPLCKHSARVWCSEYVDVSHNI